MIENVEYIVGKPSGQIINLLTKDLYFIMKKDYIHWDVDINEFSFDDVNIDLIKHYLKETKEGDLIRVLNTDKTGVIEEIIEDYQGEIIKGKDVSNIFNFGDTIYLIKFLYNKKFGTYKEYQIKKVLIDSRLFV